MNFSSHPAMAVEYIRKHIADDFVPEVGLILGSGLGVLAEELEQAASIAYEDIPGFSDCTVAGHGGFLHCGYLSGVPVACMQGRAHYYEGVANQDILTPIRALKLLGCNTLIATNATGSLNPEVTPGNLVLINDHINFMFNNPLVGPNDDRFGPRFIGLDDAYDVSLRNQFKSIAKELDIALPEGVYFGVLGPSFETPAEIRAFKMMGGDVVGMSTIPEVITARHCGLRVAVVSVITNLAAGLNPTVLNHEETLEGAKLAAGKLIALFQHFFAQYNSMKRES